MLSHALKTLGVVAVTAPPFFVLLTGCSFSPPRATADGLLYINIEVSRECASANDVDMGINIAKQDEQGFWVNKSSMFGLDYSPQALAACSGMPQKVNYKNDFPKGSEVCLPTEYITSKYPDVIAAAHGECDFMNLKEPDGTPYRCDHIAWPAHRVTGIIPDGCDKGQVKMGFQDPRALPSFHNANWINKLNATIEPDNTLKKMSATPDYDAGADAGPLFDVTVNAAFEFEVKETDTERMAGFADEPNDPSQNDIIYGVQLLNNGTLRVLENGIQKAISPYTAGDKIRLAVVNGGTIIAYYRGTTLLYAGTLAPANHPKLRATVALKDNGATIGKAQTTF